MLSKLRPFQNTRQMHLSRRRFMGIIIINIWWHTQPVKHNFYFLPKNQINLPGKMLCTHITTLLGPCILEFETSVLLKTFFSRWWNTSLSLKPAARHSLELITISTGGVDVSTCCGSWACTQLHTPDLAFDNSLTIHTATRFSLCYDWSDIPETLNSSAYSSALNSSAPPLLCFSGFF